MNISANPLLEASSKVSREEIELSENNQNAWCSVKLMGTSIFDPYIEFWFNSTYVIERVSIAGHPNISSTMGRVTAFLIQNGTDLPAAFIDANVGRFKVCDVHPLILQAGLASAVCVCQCQLVYRYHVCEIKAKLMTSVKIKPFFRFTTLRVCFPMTVMQKWTLVWMSQFLRLIQYESYPTLGQ